MANFEVNWVFGLNFDDHEDNYVTLHNRDFSKQILNKFDKMDEQDHAGLTAMKEDGKAEDKAASDDVAAGSNRSETSSII